MADAAAPPPLLDEQRYQLERERFLLDQRRLALEESWPRKWGSVVLSAAASLSAAVIAGGLSLAQNWEAQSAADRAANAARLAAAHTAEQAERQREMENDRTALDMYFRYVADRPGAQPHLSDHIQLLESIASNRTMLDRLGAQQTRAALANRQGEAPSIAVAGQPDLKPQRVGHHYVSADFTGYVQYADGRGTVASQVADALRALGMRVEGTEAIPTDKSPDHNEIRIYRTAHRAAGEALARSLGQATGQAFAVRAVGNDTLPDGIIEVWLGKS